MLLCCVFHMSTFRSTISSNHRCQGYLHIKFIVNKILKFKSNKLTESVKYHTIYTKHVSFEQCCTLWVQYSLEKEWWNDQHDTSILQQRSKPKPTWRFCWAPARACKSRATSRKSRRLFCASDKCDNLAKRPVGCPMANHFPDEKKGFSQKSRKVAFWVDDNVQRFHAIPSSLSYTFQIPEKSSEKKNIQYLMSRGHVELHTIQIHPLYTAVDTKIRLRWGNNCTKPPASLGLICIHSGCHHSH